MLARFSAFLAACAIAVAAFRLPTADAAVDPSFTWQGRLEESGRPFNGAVDLEFRLFDAASAGRQIGQVVSLRRVVVTEGLFTVIVNAAGQFGPTAFNGDNRWLEISVNGTPLSPRQPMTATPHSIFALNADTLDGLDSADFLRSIPVPLWLSGSVSVGGLVSANNSSANIGATAIRGEATASGQSYGVFGLSQGSTGRGVFGWAQSGAGANFGVYGRSDSTSGVGVYGWTTADTGTTFGVSGESASTSGRGMFGLATAATGATFGVYGQSDSTTGTGVFGHATADTGTNYGGRFTSSSASGRGVYGLATTSSGDTFGVYGRSASTTGRGVFGEATAATGAAYGVEGESNSTTGRGVSGTVTTATGVNYGVYGSTASTSGRAVGGVSTAGTGSNYGVYGRSDSTSGRGVYGAATAATGQNYGGRFTTASSEGFGVYGLAAANTGVAAGGYFESESSDGAGVWGIANSTYGIGVRGESTSTFGWGVLGRGLAESGVPYGVIGVADDGTDGYAVWASGDMGASGVKPFRIDHPDDPANKYLLHYASESPEVINFYRGTVRLDDMGEAVVELPHYFAKINKDPSYMLTAVGVSMPGLYVAEEISEAALAAGADAEPADVAPLCTFTIAGGVPGGKVSWLVQAVRNDRWVQKRGAPVEVDKPESEQGTYLSPSLYGQPPERAFGYRPRPTPAPSQE